MANARIEVEGSDPIPALDAAKQLCNATQQAVTVVFNFECSLQNYARASVTYVVSLDQYGRAAVVQAGVTPIFCATQ